MQDRSTPNSTVLFKSSFTKNELLGLSDIGLNQESDVVGP